MPSMKYGVDVANSRLDDLDKRLLTDVRLRVGRGEVVRVLDIGCGQGGLSVALAQAGATVVALDRDDYLQNIKVRLENEPALSGSVEFVQADISEIDLSTLGNFDCVVLQRVLHYLPYVTAKNVLITLRQQSEQLYVSVTGIETEIGRHYAHRDVIIDSRWSYLDARGQELFSMTAPLCLYQEAEIHSLLKETGWIVSWSRVSDFGNCKVVATRQ